MASACQVGRLNIRRKQRTPLTAADVENLLKIFATLVVGIRKLIDVRRNSELQQQAISLIGGRFVASPGKSQHPALPQR